MNFSYPTRLCLAAVVMMLAGCAHVAPRTVYQNSTIDALLDGNYDGEVTYAEVRKHGDFGLGTFNTLDGEMVAIDGAFYQVRSNGRAYAVADEAKSPLAIVTHFHADRSATLVGPLTYASLQKQLDSLRPNDGQACAFRITGRFVTLKTRSVPAQKPPYPRLAEVVKPQPTFDFADVRGTLVGFWFPESMRHVNVPGYHFHFLTADRSAGGHVLDLQLAEGTAAMQQLTTVEIALPTIAPTTRPTSAANDELNKVEK